MDFLKYKNFYYLFSGILLIASIVGISLWGFRLGIDFKGGSILEVEFSKIRPDNEKVQEALKEFNFPELILQSTQETALILRFKEISEETHQKILNKLEELASSLDKENNLKEKRFESVGPVIGQELQSSALKMIIFALIGVSLYIAWAFRRVSRPVSSFKYGIATLIALFHDVLIICGFFSYLSHFSGVEIGIPFVVALLTLLGYSVSDTVVVFDRVRENLTKLSEKTFEGLVNKSLRQTMVRSLNTSLGVIFVLVAIYFFGGETLKYFVLALIIGIFFGTYSSIFIASPLLVSFFRKKL